MLVVRVDDVLRAMKKARRKVVRVLFSADVSVSAPSLVFLYLLPVISGHDFDLVGRDQLLQHSGDLVKPRPV